MSLPSERYYRIGYTIYDSHMLPKGWYNSTSYERSCAKVYSDDRLYKIAALDAHRNFRNHLHRLNKLETSC